MCVFQDWQERYIHPNYTHIMKDRLIETVSSNSCYVKWVAPNKTIINLSLSRVASQASAGPNKDIYSPFSSVSGYEPSGSGVDYFRYCLWTVTSRTKLASEASGTPLHTIVANIGLGCHFAWTQNCRQEADMGSKNVYL